MIVSEKEETHYFISLICKVIRHTVSYKNLLCHITHIRYQCYKLLNYNKMFNYVIFSRKLIFKKIRQFYLIRIPVQVNLAANIIR
jgi:hypothetical protein